MDDFDISGVTHHLHGSFFDEEQKPFDPDDTPKKVTNNLDLTGIAYDFPEDAQNSGGEAIELGNDQISANLDAPLPAIAKNEADENAPDEEDDEIEIEEDELQETYEQLASIEEFLDVPQEPVDHWPDGVNAESLLAMNEAYTELINCLSNKVDLALAANKEKQAKLAHRIQALHDAGQANKKKVPVLLYLPPYFKDENMMCAPLSTEARVKQRITDYDPLMKEEKKWSNSEIQQLQKAVKEAMIAIYLEPYLSRKRELEDYIKSAGQDVTKAQISMWKDEHEGLVRKNSYASEMTFETLMAAVDQKQIDWTMMSNINFNGMRTAQALELKWLNEISPRWSRDPWTDEEVKKLKKLREEDKFVSWALLADRLGTRRTPWQCFSKYKKDIYQQTKEWTQAEDEKLIALCSMMQMNGNINWDKVTYYMPGRNRQQVRVRYMRTLDKNVKHGKWSEQEDLLLMCAVNRLGAQDWSKIAKAVAGRTDTQCRERWVSVLDRRVHPKEWTLEEDEKLLFLMSVFGHNAWSKCASFLNSRSGDQCRYRYQSLMNSKIRLCMAKTISAKDTSVAEYNARHSLKKIRVNRLYQRFGNIMTAVADAPEDGTVNFVHEEQERKDGMKRLKLSEGDMEVLQKEMQKIEARHKEGLGVDQAEILNAVQVTQCDLNNYLKRKERQKASNNSGSRSATPGYSRQKGRKIRMAKAFAESAEVKNRYKNLMASDSALTEEEVISGQYEVLMDTVYRHDNQEWSSEFQKMWKDAGGAIAEDFIKEMLTGRLEEQVMRLAAGENLGAGESLPISYSNCDFLNLMERVRPRLMKEASFIFHRSDVRLTDPGFAHVTETKKFTHNDALYIRLPEELKKYHEYLTLKAVMRNVLLEPMMFEDAVASQAQIQNLKKIDLDLRERKVEEDAIAQGLAERPHIDLPETRPRTVHYDKNEENMPFGEWLLKQEEPQVRLPPIGSLLMNEGDEELVEEEEPEIDVTGLPPPYFIQVESAPGPSSTTPVSMTTLDMPTRKRRNSSVAKKKLSGISTEEKPLETSDNDDMVTPFRPTAGVRRLSSIGADLPMKKMREE